jgi:voltage-dependent potassium channel beta subunit
MEYRRLGRSGLQVSALSLGSWLTFGNQITDDVAKSIMFKAYDEGINFFDNAEQYAAGASEITMGKILANSGWSRDTFVVSSKVFWGGPQPNQWGLSRKHVIEACHAALKRLQVEYLDLYFCHRPDINTPMEETVRAMSDLIQQGKVLYWGTSEWSAQEIQDAIGTARQYNLIPPIVEQPQYNMFHRERFENEYLRLFKDYGYGSTIWSPLAGGLLSGKYNHGIPEGSRPTQHTDLGWLVQRFENDEAQKRIAKVADLKKIGDDLGLSLPVLSLAWCLKNPNVSTVILGASKLPQLEENLKAVDATPMLTPAIMAKLDEILANKPVSPMFGPDIAARHKQK